MMALIIEIALEMYGMQYSLKDLLYLLKNKIYPYEHTIWKMEKVYERISNLILYCNYNICYLVWFFIFEIELLSLVEVREKHTVLKKRTFSRYLNPGSREKQKNWMLKKPKTDKGQDVYRAIWQLNITNFINNLLVILNIPFSWSVNWGPSLSAEDTEQWDILFSTVCSKNVIHEIIYNLENSMSLYDWDTLRGKSCQKWRNSFMWLQTKACELYSL